MKGTELFKNLIEKKKRRHHIYQQLNPYSTHPIALSGVVFGELQTI